jgi:hypothetical protein
MRTGGFELGSSADVINLEMAASNTVVNLWSLVSIAMHLNQSTNNKVGH